MKKQTWRAFAVVAAASITDLADAQTPGPPQSVAFDAHGEVHAAIEGARKVAMNRDRLDWAAIEERAQAEAANAKDEADLLPVYARLLFQLDDNRHSMVIPLPPTAAAYKARYGDRAFLAEPQRPIHSRFVGQRDVTATDVELAGGRVARKVSVPAYNDSDADGRFAGAIYTGLAATPAACGYIVDLRGNTGGNTFPMVAGLSPLLGEGFRMAVPTDTGMATVALQSGAANGYETPTSAPFKLAAIPNWHAFPALALAPVAVLFDDATASAGEGVAVEFLHRPATRTFGTTTRGHVSANVPVPAGGAMLMVTTALVPDRTGATYRSGLVPDEPVAAGKEGASDPVVRAASVWLSQQAACRPH